MDLRTLAVKSALAMVLLGLALVAPVAGQDATAVLDGVRQAMGGNLTGTLRISAAGSGYAADNGEASSRRHFRIETYTQEFDFGSTALSERIVRADHDLRGAEAGWRTETRLATRESPWTDQYAVWTTPHGFIAGASSHAASVATEILHGTTYRVVTFTAGSGQQVRGYVNSDNVLERARTEVDDPRGGKVQVESVYLDWADFGGVRFPRVMIQKENDQLARVLIVQNVTF